MPGSKAPSLAACLAALTATLTSNPASAAEVCGNGIDDDADNYADEGCGFANWVMGVCESPLSCGETGDIDPVTGAWAYQLPADIAPKVPFGPKFEFRRTYMSMYSPPATNYRTAMGNRWQHNFQSWLDLSGTSPNRVAIVHMPTGQELKFRESGTPGDGNTYYNNFQPGTHFKWLRQATSGPNNWELRTLTGEKYIFSWASPVGKLIEVHDTLATPNKITIAYFTSGGNNGQINTVTDASAHKRFRFSYSQGRVSSVAYQTGSGSTWTTRVTLSLSYASSNPTTVQIGGSTVQTNSYTAGYLTNITDGGGKTIVSVNYVSSTPGKVANLTTEGGGIGYDYASANAQCMGQTALFFNLASTTACNVDGDCNPGLRCGGKTGTGSTGKCFRAARCLTTSSPTENVITSVTPFTPCTGACAPIAQYSWNTTTLDLKGIKLADNNWTSFQRNSNGMVTLMSQGDTDDDPTNTAILEHKTWFFYGDSDFPGRITEARRRTDTSSANTCDGVFTFGCKQTLYSWQDPSNLTDGLLQQKQDIGLTIGLTGGTTLYTYTTAYSYDTKGRLTLIDGPLDGSNDVTEFTYWTSSDVLKDGYTNLRKRKKDSSSYLTITIDRYDSFGNGGSTQQPDGTLTCRTWDANRNYLSQNREAMNAQSSCTDPTHESDLITSYVRDTSLRLTKITKPVGNCVHREYDGFGRPQYVKLRDDCVATSSGNTKTISYNANGLSETTELADSTGAVKHRQKRVFTDGMQIAGYENPVSPSYSRTFSYFVDGSLEWIYFENNLGKTQVERDSKDRETKDKRYTSASSSLDWVFNYPAANGTATPIHEKVTDPAFQQVTTLVDDLGRRTSISSPDSGTTSYGYDAASRLVSRSDALGFSDSFTYDNLNRRLTENYGTETSCPSNPIDVTYTYDALPGSSSCPGISGCPAGATCTRLAGKLAHAKVVLLCPAGGAAVFQETYYGYDDNGRLLSEFVCDTTGRTAQQNYAWDKSGNLTDVKTPSGASQTNTYGSVSSNSDANQLTTIARTMSGTPTNLLTNLAWAPNGPVTSYDMANTIGGLVLKASLTWNLAYRATQIKYATTSTNKTTIDYTEDAKGRYTQKLYSNVHSNILNDYLTYDWLDRPTCDAPTAGACPISSSTPYANASYDSSNNRSAFSHSAPGFGDIGYQANYYAGTDKLDSVSQVEHPGEVFSSTDYDWNARGDRWFEDSDNSSADRREYTYDGRSRVRNVIGKLIRPQNGAIQDYQITYAFDHRERLVFRAFLNVTTGIQQQTFYYYDLNDRIIEIKDVPNVSDLTTYTLYNFYWVGERPVVEWATAFPGASTARYFMHTDESNRVLEVYTWPSSGDATLVWAINPDVFGWDNVATSSIFQPFRLNNRIVDDGTRAPKSWSGFVTTFNRPALLIGRGVHYDPMTESNLQRRGEWPDEPYTDATHNPAMLGGIISWYLWFILEDNTGAFEGGGWAECGDVNEWEEGPACFGGSGGGTSCTNPDKCCAEWSCHYQQCDNPFFSCASCAYCANECLRQAHVTCDGDGPCNGHFTCHRDAYMTCVNRPSGPNHVWPVSCSRVCDCFDFGITRPRQECGAPGRDFPDFGNPLGPLTPQTPSTVFGL